MKINDQFDAIMALPIGGAIIACALGFFFLLGSVMRHVIERRAMLRDLADRMPGRSDV